jgi:hypothetical protein
MKKRVEETLDQFADAGYINYVIEWLEENNFINQGKYDLRSVSEQEYENALNKLKDNYMSISKEDEQTIINIAKRF